MHNEIKACFLTVLLTCPLIGCSVEQASDSENEATTQSALESVNALTLNALTLNALTLNALTLNALTLNALSPSALASIQDPGPSGDLARQALKYTVGCGLDATQSFSFSWTDSLGTSHQETYMGSLGLEASWATKPLNAKGEHWISACLASRVNWYGVPVLLSLRGAHPALKKSGTAELSTYTRNEGAFWGNLFGSPPALYACNYAPDISYSRSQQRDCAAGHLDLDGNEVDCGMIHIAGSCEALCDPLNPTGSYYPSCSATGDGADTTAKVVTVFLQ